jgi:lipopolysaccharide/colanic/teichoic acid biosynthesis glycosyltransferase
MRRAGGCGAGTDLKRLFDIALSISALFLLSPIVLTAMFVIWLQDHQSPLFFGARVAMGGGTFEMVKLRSMVKHADRTGVESTSANDNRITPVGRFVRRWKLDELTQLWNVAKGEMSLVGPRPNTAKAVAGYTKAEMGLLDVRPGITDFSSIIFADEGDILKDSADADEGYDQLIRPWKSRLGLIYAKNAGIVLDCRIIFYTALGMFNRRRALDSVVLELRRLGAPEDVIAVARRDKPLQQAGYLNLPANGHESAPTRQS